MISDLDLFAMVLGYVCVDVTFASRDGWEDGSVNFGKGRAFRLSGLLRVNYEAELQVTCYLTEEGFKICFGRNPAREQKRILGQNSVRKL
jgi:hypothetical protein